MENEFRKLLFDGLPLPSASEACLFDCLRAVVPLILSEDKCKEPSDARVYTQLSQCEDGDEGWDGDGDDDNNYGDDVHWDGEE